MFKPDHYAVSVSDADRSIEFYSKLEFTVVKDWRAEDGSVRIVHMENQGLILELFSYPDSGKVPEFVETLSTDLKVQGSKHLGLQVEDLEAAAEYLYQGGIVKAKPVISKGRMGRDYFFVKDPDGIFVEIIAGN